MTPESRPPRGRGAADNPLNRFERLEVVPEEAPPDRVTTLFLRDDSRTIITRNDSPDVPFEVSINPYRGCEHGCTYCYARPYHEYLGFSAGLDFETRILVKEDAPELLREAIAAPRWEPKILAISGVTDPYQPIERKLELTRRCLAVLAEHHHPAAVITKNALVTRDIDLLGDLARHGAATVAVSITSLDPSLTRVMEPRTSHPRDKLKALESLALAGIPCGVSIAPVIPGLTDHEIPQILSAAAEHGASWANWLLLRLPGAVESIFRNWLAQAFPERSDKVLNRIRSLRGGALNDTRFGRRMRGEGVFADQIRSLFEASVRRCGLSRVAPRLSTAAFGKPGGHQLGLPIDG